jgi:hypothetical protein
MATSRAIGVAGEREAAKLFIGAMRQVEYSMGIFALIDDQPNPLALSNRIERNLQQSASGGHDLLGIPFYAVEVKKVEKPQLGAFWEQACEQAKRVNLEPLLVYKMGRQDWRCRCRVMHRSGNLVVADCQLMAWMTEFQIEYWKLLKSKEVQ